ncbi:hypothetical protein [Streptomyces viridochromogenes]|nr:hypothetical protein [Streptomyces viridochromogenes]
MNHTGIPADVHPVWPAPDAEPVDVTALTSAVRAAWITPDLIADLED